MKAYFDDYSEFVEFLFDELIDENITVIGDYDTIIKTIKAIFSVEDAYDFDFDVPSIEIEDGSSSGYCGPYMLTISENEIWCEEAYSSKGIMLKFDANYVFSTSEYFEEAKNSCLRKADYYELCIGEKNNNPEEKLHLIYDENDAPCGFEFEKEDNDSCFYLKYCECKPNIGRIIERYNDFGPYLAKWFY